MILSSDYTRRLIFAFNGFVNPSAALPSPCNSNALAKGPAMDFKYVVAACANLLYEVQR